MANHLRQLRGGRVSFFLFMDTITAVTAMLIMVSLMMTLYFGDAPAAMTGGGDPARLRETLAEVERISAENQTSRLQLASIASAPTRERLRTDIADLKTQVTNQAVALAGLQKQLNEQQTETQRRANELGVGEEYRQVQTTKQQTESVRNTNRLAQLELEELTRKISALEPQLEKTKRERAKLWLIPEADGSGKRPLLVSLSATNMVCERFNQPQSRRVFTVANAEREFEALLNEIRPDRDYLVFYIRPSGIQQFQRYHTLARRAGFNVGYDAVEEDRQILFNSPQAEL